MDDFEISEYMLGEYEKGLDSVDMFRLAEILNTSVGVIYE